MDAYDWKWSVNVISTEDTLIMFVNKQPVIHNNVMFFFPAITVQSYVKSESRTRFAIVRVYVIDPRKRDDADGS